MTQEILVLGGGPVGHALAGQLHAADRAVAFVDDDVTAVRRAHDAGIDAHESPLESDAVPSHLSASIVVVATPSDARNLLLAASAADAFDARRVLALVNDPGNRPAFADADFETVCVSETLSSVAVTRVGERVTNQPESPVERVRE